MKTLYEYFTEVYANELDNYNYETTKEILIEELKANHYVSDLKIFTLIYISDIIQEDLNETLNILFKLKNN